VTDTLDYLYAVAGDVLDRGYPFRLLRALQAALPWLADEPLAGVHPLRGLTPCADGYLVGGRTRLVLRAPATRAGACATLEGTLLEVPAPLRVGRVNARELLPYPVLHAKLVVTGAEDEARFAADVEGEIERMQLDCEIIIGRRGEICADDERVSGFSLMLHGLSPEDSVRAQAHGLGRHRTLGCGIFVPHKSVAAVGA
jgi:CRISPR-associated protein Cas6